MIEIGQYKVEGFISKGAFGKVYKASKGGEVFAIKEVARPQDRSSRKRLNTQIQALSGLRHCNIVRLHEIVEEQAHTFLVMEYCPETLSQFLDKWGKMDEPRAYEIMRQLVKGLDQMRGLGIVHRDLKPSNILHCNGVFKIADLGLAKFTAGHDELLRSALGTLGYMAPQLLAQDCYTSKCDIWSLGAIFYKILFASLPWNPNHANGRQTHYHHILCHPLTFPKELAQETKNLLRGMLSVNQYERLSWEQVTTTFLTEAPKEFRQSPTHMLSIRGLNELLLLELDQQSQVHHRRLFCSLSHNEQEGIISQVQHKFGKQWRPLVDSLVPTLLRQPSSRVPLLDSLVPTRRHSIGRVPLP